MPRRKKIRICDMCGTRVDVNPRSNLCLTCALIKQGESVRQLKAKEGPIYDKWKAGLLKHLGEVAETG